MRIRSYHGSQAHSDIRCESVHRARKCSVKRSDLWLGRTHRAYRAVDHSSNDVGPRLGCREDRRPYAESDEDVCFQQVHAPNPLHPVLKSRKVRWRLGRVTKGYNAIDEVLTRRILGNQHIHPIPRFYILERAPAP